VTAGRNTRGGHAERTAPPRTKCKICWCSVFPEDDTMWVTSPQPGIAHTTCTKDQKD